MIPYGQSVRAESRSTVPVSMISDVQISHRDQYFKLGGILSEVPDEKINLVFDHFNLANLNGVTQSSGFQLGGILNGRLRFQMYTTIRFLQARCILTA